MDGLVSVISVPDTILKFAGRIVTGGLLKLFDSKATSFALFTPRNPAPVMVNAVPPADGSTSVESDVTSWIGANVNSFVFDGPGIVSKDTGIEFPGTVGPGPPSENNAGG